MRYSGFARIDGTHPYRMAMPNGFVDYAARTRPGGKVFYFNFGLAKEMGLIAQNHPEALNKELSKAILGAFSLEIINEYDVLHKRRFPANTLKPNRYMATRYLQCQHPDKRGNTSGDGRSIWNGYFKAKRGAWDISSCGTGATSLSPATAIEGKFFKTGDKNVSYGGGRADLADGISAALMSDIFHRNNIPTERTLAVISYKDGSAINVRAYQNLLRPAHLFRYLKQGNYAELKSGVDYYIDRQVENGLWEKQAESDGTYPYFLQKVAYDFAHVAALFESEYIFCWMEWDGDNILMDGAIIDYGSVRQFGLFHREYRYDDAERMSTTIAEQKNKAKYTVQVFAQIVDFLVTKRKKSLKHYANHAMLNYFDEVFEATKNQAMTHKLGFSPDMQSILANDRLFSKDLKEFRKICDYFERAQSKKGVYEVSDGITSNAIFCLRDILRELPKHYFSGNNPMPAEEFIGILRSEYGMDEDMALTPTRKAKIKRFQELYCGLVRRASHHSHRLVNKLMADIRDRVALINRYDRVTGDAILYVADKMMKAAEKLHMNSALIHDIFREFVEQQILDPEYFTKTTRHSHRLKGEKINKVFDAMLKNVRDMRSGI
jgi:uncharacterized protein YdiU (UPF0061 family)